MPGLRSWATRWRYIFLVKYAANVFLKTFKKVEFSIFSSGGFKKSKIGGYISLTLK